MTDLEKHMDDAFAEAEKRLGNDLCAPSRDIHFLITEIDRNNDRQHWYLDTGTRKFIRLSPCSASELFLQIERPA